MTEDDPRDDTGAEGAQRFGRSPDEASTPLLQGSLGTSGVGAKAARGAAWMGAGRFVSQATSLVVFVILGRLLSPRAFGLVATANAVLWLLRALSDQGFSGLLVQRHEISTEDTNTAFWTSLAGGMILTSAVAIAAPTIAAGFGQPRLTLILRVLSVVFVIAALDATQSALLNRALEFRKQSLRIIVANLVSSVVAVALALAGAGVWALVIQTIVLEAISVLLLWGQANWHPSWSFSKESFREMFRPGMSLMGSRLLVSVGGNADNLLIGVVLGPVSLGYYVVAFRVISVINDLAGTAFMHVALSSFARLSKDEAALNRALCKAATLVAFVTFPVYAGLAVVARPLIVVCFGPKWAPSGMVLVALTIGGFVQAQMVLTSQYVIALGKMGNEFLWTAALIVAEVAGFGVAVNFGTVPVALSLGVVLLTAWPIRVRMLNRWGGLRVRDYVAPIGRLGTAAGIMAASVDAIRLASLPIGMTANLALELVVGLMTYPVVTAVLAPEVLRSARSLTQRTSLARLRLPRRNDQPGTA